MHNTGESVGGCCVPQVRVEGLCNTGESGGAGGAYHRGECVWVGEWCCVPQVRVCVWVGGGVA